MMKNYWYITVIVLGFIIVGLVLMLTTRVYSSRSTSVTLAANAATLFQGRLSVGGKCLVWNESGNDFVISDCNLPYSDDNIWFFDEKRHLVQKSTGFVLSEYISNYNPHWRVLDKTQYNSVEFGVYTYTYSDNTLSVDGTDKCLSFDEPVKLYGNGEQNDSTGLSSRLRLVSCK